MQVVEFLIEPFIEGDPGPHVQAAIAAVEALGGEVDFGALSSTCRTDDDEMPGIVAALLAAAFTNGASGVRLSVERDEAAP